MKLLKDLVLMLIVVAVILLAHAIPELVVRFVPAWILLPFSFGFLVFLVWAAWWAFEQAFRANKEGNK